MNPSIAMIAVTAIPGFSYPQGELRPATAASVVYRHHASTPIPTYRPDKGVDPSPIAALELLALGSELFPDAKPLTVDERASINEFFWSHFQ